MRFEHILWMHGVWLIIALAFFLWWAFRRKQRVIETFVHPKLHEDIAKERLISRETLKAILLVGVFLCSVLALARPQWGFHWQEIKRQGLDIVIAMDVSRSMLTQDVKPNRLERAKLAVKDLIKKLEGDRLGLVAFAGSAVTVCPLTVDYGGFLLALDDLSPQTVSVGGTSLSLALEEAIRGFQEISGSYRVVVVISDGEDMEGHLDQAIDLAKKNGIKVFCIGMGTPDGELVAISDDQGGQDFLKDDQGRFVKSRLDENTLKKIALLTDGAYVRSAGAQTGLDHLYQTHLSLMEKREIEARMRKQHIERFQFPLAVALVLLIVEAVLSRRRRL